MRRISGAVGVRQRPFYLLWFVMCLLTVLCSYCLRDSVVDDAYITYRHAKNMVAGDGFSFNPDDRLLSTTSPLHALLLAAVSVVVGGSIPHSAMVLSAVSMLFLQMGLLCIDRERRLYRAPYVGMICVSFVAVQHWLYRFYSLETILVIALNVAAIAAFLNEKWSLSGAMVGLAIVGRPDSVTLAGTIGLWILVTHWPSRTEIFRYALPCALLCALWFGYATIAYGSPFPNTLAAKSGFGWLTFAAAIWPKILRHFFLDAGVLSFFVLCLAGVGFVILLRRRSPMLVFPLWGLAITIGYTVLRISYPFSWYYAPLILIVLVLASVGGASVGQRLLSASWQTPRLLGFSRMVVLGIVVFLWVVGLRSVVYYSNTYRSAYYVGARDRVYREVARWLRDNSSETATVAAAEVGTIGYYSDRHIIDVLGLVTYELRDLPKQGNYLDVILCLQPTYILGVHGLPPVPDLSDIEGYVRVAEFPQDGHLNQFEDIVVYARQSTEAGMIWTLRP